MTAEQKAIAGKVGAHAFLILFVCLVLVPFIMVISASLRQGNFAPSRLVPDKVSFDHWKFVLGIPYQEIVNPATGETRLIKATTPPLLWFWNSIKVSMVASAGIICLSGTAAYAFARLRFKFRGVTLNTLLCLIMVYLGCISGYIWMIKGYFDTIPSSMEESARIDGASQFQTFLHILLPISLPIFAVVFVLSFISYMSEYPVASVVLQSSDNWTLA